ncbi:MAG: hypothetical protein SP1CHLAM54_12780 [Chlamydiia bacterium]|nr:hypothetical protein [Chlamydiia bacterium]MCH9616175.1 hypothetical protein [Chlamydiia bacterium]MCH9629839.1 hypothetical protein [Chlamydiia bacterium]
MELTTKNKAQTTSTLIIVGDIQDVLDGTAHTTWDLPLSTIQCGLGAGLFNTYYSDAIVINNTAHGTYRNTLGQDLSTQENTTLTTPFLAYLDQDQLPSATATLTAKTPISLDTLYEALLEYCPYGFAIEAKVTFTQINACYLIKAPIYNEPIMGPNLDTYVARHTSHKEEHAQIFGIVYGPTAPKQPKAIYQNPNDTNSTQSHTHIHTASQTFHLLTQSTLKHAEITLYKLSANQ